MALETPSAMAGGPGPLDPELAGFQALRGTLSMVGAQPCSESLMCSPWMQGRLTQVGLPSRPDAELVQSQALHGPQNPCSALPQVTIRGSPLDTE